MPATKSQRSVLPRRFEDLVRELPPQAIMDDVEYGDALNMVDRLMAAGKLSKGQERYMETLVQLVQVYEAKHYDIAGATGLDLLKHVLDENGMNASDLARILGVHVSMGSKILKGERALTLGHARTLAGRFKLRFDAFLDG